VPRRRLELDRHEKVDEIVSLAVARLRAGGFAQLTMKGIARDLGLATGAVYWYFPSRDHLFVKALAKIFLDTWATKPSTECGLDHQILWFADRLAELQPLFAALRDRAEESDVAADFAANIDAQLRALLSAALSERDIRETETTADALLSLAEGLAARRESPDRRHDIMRLALRELCRT
jgi:AcrR family transcriptional regulator